MRDHDRRISAAQFKNGEDVIRRRLRGMNFRLFTRLHTGTAVYTKGNESRMGTGKGSFDHWASRVPVSRVVFELKADVHEQVVRDAFRLAANKMPGNSWKPAIFDGAMLTVTGLYEFVKRGDPPVMGITKLAPHMAESDIKRPRKKLPGEEKGHRLPGANESPLSTGNPGPAPGQTF